VEPQALVHPDPGVTLGSNAWAIHGHRTADGRGMVANDMHLGLGLPNTWFRMQFVWHDDEGKEWRCIGVTLPGTPAMAVGSNGQVAWGVTAAQLDVSDQVLLESDPAHPDACRVGSEWIPFEIFREQIKIAGQSNVLAEVRWSPWGPVGTNILGQRVAFRWAMALPEAANFRLLEFERMATTRELLEKAPSCGLPWLNVLVADNAGNIGWTLGGRFPKRFGFGGSAPASWSDGEHGWNGWIEAGKTPSMVNPSNGALWSANNRALGSEEYRDLAGGDATDQGVRAGQIRDQLLGLTNATPADSLAIQLDDRALFLEPWQRLMVRTLRANTNQARVNDALALVSNWGQRAATNSAGYRLVRGFRHETLALLLAPVVTQCKSVSKQFKYLPGHHEGVAWDLLGARPLHLLPQPYASYDELLADAARRTLDRVPPERNMADWTWGDANRVRLRHPFGQAIPPLSRWLDLPQRQLPGDNNMPRVQSPAAGASERLVVSPGLESQGLFHMPGGQSGHFLSPFYAAGHSDWEEGRSAPLLPGSTKHRLKLVP
jgi:penicillin amidase